MWWPARGGVGGLAQRKGCWLGRRRRGGGGVSVVFGRGNRGWLKWHFESREIAGMEEFTTVEGMPEVVVVAVVHMVVEGW